MSVTRKYETPTYCAHKTQDWRMCFSLPFFPLSLGCPYDSVSLSRSLSRSLSLSLCPCCLSHLCSSSESHIIRNIFVLGPRSAPPLSLLPLSSPLSPPSIPVSC